MNTTKRPRPFVLIVMDGWGINPRKEGNAIALAHTPNIDRLAREWPHTAVKTSGAAVGLPEGQMGNSEVGHQNIGAGKRVLQDYTRVNESIRDGSFFSNPALLKAIEHVKKNSSQLHICGLLGNGGVHAHESHLEALLRLAHMHDIERVYIHSFTDGRDTSPTGGIEFMRQLQTRAGEIGGAHAAKVATVSGRYYAMDRDNRWERVELAYRALVHGEAETRTDDPLAALQRSYEANVTDEFVKPIVVTKGSGASAAPVGLIRDDDAVIFYNFRADRARHMTYALAAPDFDKFVDVKRPKNLFFVAMTQYDKNWPWLKYVIAPEKLEHILAQVFAELQYKNLRTAETEKYAHVTYFFNGGVEKPFAGEERILVPSPKVATYDLKPEMSAAGITDTVVKAIEKGEFDAIIMNYANADMVGHSGKLEAAIKAVEAVDAGLARIYQALKPRGGVWMITADHGNAETMIDPATGGPHTYHTTNAVPFILVSDDDKVRLKPGGSLRDIAPTMLGALEQPRPVDMTGNDLRIIS